MSARETIDLLKTRANSNCAEWRPIERCLIDYFRSLHVPMMGGSGAFVEVALHVDPDESETIWLSIENLARHLAAELDQ